MKKLLSLFLSCLILLSAVLPLCASAAERTLQDIPIVTVPGTSNCHILNEAGKTIVPDNVEISTILEDKELMTDLLTEFGKAVVTDRWETYCDKLVAALAPIWEEQHFDANGDPREATHINRQWTEAKLKKKTSGFAEGDYTFNYDWRFDPYVSADELHEYIQAVLRVTGKQQVGLVGRCYGACVVAAYLEKYGDEGLIDTCIMNCPMAKGVETVDAVFSGEFELDADNVEMYLNYYLNQQKPIEDEDITLFLSSLVTVMAKTCSLQLTGDVLIRLIGKFKDNILPRLLRVSYGSYPGYWGMVGDEAFEKAVRFVFGGHEDEYAGMIQRIRKYHDQVQVPLFDILDSLIADGMNIIVITKYGTPAYPYFKGCDYQTDSSCSIYRMSFGATACPIDETLSDEYIAAAKANGTDKYISKDRKIDASTCRYRDSTWFFKDVDHLDLAPFISGLMTYSTACTDQLTVFNDPGTVQFMRRDDNGVFVEVPEDDKSDLKWDTPNFFKAFCNMIKAAFRVIRDLLKNLIKK